MYKIQLAVLAALLVIAGVGSVSGQDATELRLKQIGLAAMKAAVSASAEYGQCTSRLTSLTNELKRCNGDKKCFDSVDVSWRAQRDLCRIKKVAANSTTDNYAAAYNDFVTYKNGPNGSANKASKPEPAQASAPSKVPMAVKPPEPKKPEQTAGGSCVPADNSGRACSLQCSTEFAGSSNNKPHPVLKTWTYKNIKCVNSCGRSYSVKLCFDRTCETRSVSAFGTVGKQLDPYNVDHTYGDFVSATPMCN